jgi:hypothetical protein
MYIYVCVCERDGRQAGGMEEMMDGKKEVRNEVV